MLLSQKCANITDRYQWLCHHLAINSSLVFNAYNSSTSLCALSTVAISPPGDVLMAYRLEKRSRRCQLVNGRIMPLLQTAGIAQPAIHQAVNGLHPLTAPFTSSPSPCRHKMPSPLPRTYVLKSWQCLNARRCLLQKPRSPAARQFHAATAA